MKLTWGHNVMNRTIRRYIDGPGRDGKQDWRTRIARDNRATGLRTQKRDRRVAKAAMKSGQENSLSSGKRRRYSDRYGDYEL